MGKVDDNKKQKKHTLLRAAFQLFTEKGFSKTTVADIVDRAGLAKGTFICTSKTSLTCVIN